MTAQSRQKCLMLGPGTRKVERKFSVPGYSLPADQVDWTTVDIRGEPDILMDLNDIERGWPLPVGDESFDEIHAYSVLGLYGTQGDYVGWFAGWREFWRILKPGGYFVGGVPRFPDRWAFGDAATKRIIQPTTLLSLTKEFYEKEKGATDYRSLVEPYWWEIVHSKEELEVWAFYFGLKKIS